MSLSNALYRYAVPHLERAAGAARRRTGLPFEDLLAEANMIYFLCSKGYNYRRRIDFVNYLNASLYQGLGQYERKCRRENGGLRRDRKTPILTRVELTDTVPETQDWTDQLSPESMEVVRLALGKRNHKPKAIRRSIVQTLLRRGLPIRQIRNAFNEIRSALA